ncbi:MAG: ATP-binding protein, partial [Bdellovibrionota bacterium]
VNLSELVYGLSESLRKTNPERVAEFRIADSLTAFVDRRLIKIALENLLGNAWKFTNKRAITIIEFGSLNHEVGKAFFIRDNGAGFDMAYASKLFGAFQRLHAATEYPGTGIGLATVRRIINRHGGKIWAEGVVDQGATFYFTLA